MDIVAQIKIQHDHLRPAEQTVANIILADLYYAAHASISELADKAKVSHASITRLAKTLGCKNVREFKVKIAQAYALEERFISDKMVKKKQIPEIYHSIISSLEHNANLINTSMITKATHLLTKAKHVLIFGVGGGSTIMAQECHHRLFRLGVYSNAYSDPMLMRMTASNIDKDDVVICLSLSGFSPDVKESAQIAKDYGAKVITICPEGDLSPIADIHLPIEINETEYIFKPSTSRYVMLAAIDILANEIKVSSKWQQWQFSMPRLKGSAVNGSFTIFEHASEVGGVKYTGIIDIKGRDQQLIHNIDINNNEIRFNLDTWMGPFQARFNIINNQALAGAALIGNTPYPIEGHFISSSSLSENANIPKVNAAINRLPSHEKNIIGGEATIWSELVGQHNLDLRIWPRTYAIAERFWSPQQQNDVVSMYARLDFMDTYSQTTIGLKQNKQQQAILQNLVSKNDDIIPILILAEAVEQAQYYTRHHVKHLAGNYHNEAPLDQFVDALPAESKVLVQMNLQIDEFQRQNCDITYLGQFHSRLLKWQHNSTPLKALIQRSPQLRTLDIYADEVAEISRLGLMFIDKIIKNEHLSTLELNTTLKKLKDIVVRKGEVISSAALMLERLVETCN